jgi:hypothetical protein
MLFEGHHGEMIGPHYWLANRSDTLEKILWKILIWAIQWLYEVDVLIGLLAASVNALDTERHRDWQLQQWPWVLLL